MYDNELTRADTTHLSIESHYLIGMAVLYTVGVAGPAGMFVRTLLHLGVTPPRSPDRSRSCVARSSTPSSTPACTR